jgi:hypothetical protein
MATQSHRGRGFILLTVRGDDPLFKICWAIGFWNLDIAA